MSPIQRASPNAKKSGQLAQGQVCTLRNVTDQNEHELVEGTFLVFNSSARIIFDGGATHSFIPRSFASTLGLECENMKVYLLVGSSLGGSKEVSVNFAR